MLVHEFEGMVITSMFLYAISRKVVVCVVFHVHRTGRHSEKTTLHVYVANQYHLRGRAWINRERLPILLVDS